MFAASSLTSAFTALAKQFEAAHPGTKVKIDFDSSSVLVTQIKNGAPADVFASADTKNMQKLQSNGDVTGTPTVFAKNQMEIAVGAEQPEARDNRRRPREPEPHRGAVRLGGPVRQVRRPAPEAGQRDRYAEVS